MFYAAARRDRSVFSTFLQPRLSRAGASAVRVATPLIIRIASKAHGSTDERARQDFARLPENLDRVDGWLGDGTLGGARRNAADYQIAPNVRAMLHFADLRRVLEGRRCAEWAVRVVPEYGGPLGKVLLREWVAQKTAFRFSIRNRWDLQSCSVFTESSVDWTADEAFRPPSS